MAKAERNAGESDGDDADEDGAAYAASHQDGDENESRGGEKNLRIGDFADSDEGSWIGDDDFRVAQTDEGDEKADAGGGAVLETIGDAVDDLFADVGESEDEKKQAGKKHDAESRLPRNAAAEDEGVSEVGVERHAGREGDGIVGPKAHDERGDGGGNASGEEDAVNGHARFGEDARIRSEERRVG